MVHVALAGCSTGFGLTLLHEIVASKKHTVTLLSRGPKPELSKLGVEVRAVDYLNHTELVQALEGVHTVISSIAPKDNPTLDAKKDTQLALIEAARLAGVKRFAPSEFAHGAYDGIDLYAFKALSWDAVQKSGMEYTRYSCGLFMNILASGTPKVDETEALAGLRPWNYVINMKAGTADLPGNGTVPITWTEIHDVCHFVVASLDLDKWPEESMMVGQNASFREVLDVAEEVRGGQKFLTKTNTIEELEKMAENPATRFYDQTRVIAAIGGFALKPTLNELCPEVKPKSLRDVLTKWWGDVQIEDPSWGENKTFGSFKDQ